MRITGNGISLHSWTSTTPWVRLRTLGYNDSGLFEDPGAKGTPTSNEKSLQSAVNRWREAMAAMSPYDRVRQVALYLLCWGEAAQVRFVPECLCFIFKCADDYYRSPECQNRIEPVPEGLYLRAVIKPLYRFVHSCTAPSELWTYMCL